MILKENYNPKLHQKKLKKLAEFVVKENFKHHTNNVPRNCKEDIELVYDEEIKYKEHSNIFVAKDNLGNIAGTIRVLKWNYVDKLPIEKIFGINPLMITGYAPIKPIWHIGRFAIRKEICDVTLFKKLVVYGILEICKDENAVAFAEIDSKLMRVLRLMGIQATIIGESINYLGSETIPVCFTYKGLINFYNKNKKLIIEEQHNSKLNKQNVLVSNNNLA
ncbi:hypothetical protein [Tenacibaculum xiamenense]|uniref:hypothetical protein n=1 Tax=Tenacibaculum xiamenense TaxID=1261553 RepID=UPI0038964208